MGGNDRLSQGLNDIRSALGLLTRLPLPATSAKARGAEAAWAFPLTGVVVGLIGALAGGLSLWLGLPVGVAAAVALGAQAMATGAMHEDGLADTVDGLWGGWDKERRLAIMKDSAIGSYGVTALLVVGLARWTALAALLSVGAWPAIVAASALSRVPMVAMMRLMPNARGTGLSQSVGRPSAQVALAALTIGLVVSGALCGAAVLFMLALATITTLALAAVARAKVGGQTGDILGASQELAEAAALAAAAAVFA